jgi:hypothetical protein
MKEKEREGIDHTHFNALKRRKDISDGNKGRASKGVEEGKEKRGLRGLIGLSSPPPSPPPPPPPSPPPPPPPPLVHYNKLLKISIGTRSAGNNERRKRPKGNTWCHE